MRYPFISRLEAVAKHRPDGYLDDVLSRGRIMGSVLELPEDKYAMLCRKYGRIPLPPRGMTRPKFHPLVNKIAALEDDTKAGRWIKSMAAQIQDRLQLARKRRMACGERKQVLKHAQEQLEYFYNQYKTRTAG